MWQVYQEIHQDDAKRMKIIGAYFSEQCKIANLPVDETTLKHMADLAYHKLSLGNGYQFTPLPTLLETIKNRQDAIDCYIFIKLENLAGECRRAYMWNDKNDLPGYLTASNDEKRAFRKDFLLSVYNKICPTIGPNKQLPSRKDMLRGLEEAHDMLADPSSRALIKDGVHLGLLQTIQQGLALIRSFFTLGHYFSGADMKGFYNLRKTMNDTRLEKIEEVLNEPQVYSSMIKFKVKA